jgi:hypothetical protein
MLKPPSTHTRVHKGVKNSHASQNLSRPTCPAWLGTNEEDSSGQAPGIEVPQPVVPNPALARH